MKRIITILAIICAIPFTLSSSYAERVEKSAEFSLHTLYKKPAIKSGASHLYDSDNNTGQARALKTAFGHQSRPSKDTFDDSANGHFRVHYNIEGKHAPDLTDRDGNSVPDFVDSTLVFLEIAWDKAVALGYGIPKSDASKGGSDAVDCYLEDLSVNGYYGHTTPDNNGLLGMTSAFITIDNNFTDTVYQTTGYDGLRVTTAHEYFHVVQFAYYGGNDGIWWMEQTAVWFEDYVWDDINDYLNFTQYLFRNRDIPIDTNNGTFEYGAALFAIHIAEKYGIDMIRTIWNRLKDKQSAEFDVVGSVLPNGPDETLAELAVWLYFTSYRANPQDFFSESDLFDDKYSMIAVDNTVYTDPAVDSLLFSHYTFKYIDIVPETGLAVGDTLKCSYTNPDNGSWIRQVILYNSPDDYSIELLNWQQPQIYITRPYEKAVFVVTNISEKDIHSKYKFVYTIDIISPLSVHEKSLPASIVLHRNYPNPFNPQTTISYSLPSAAPVDLRIFNLQGQIIDSWSDSNAESGTHRYVFDGSFLPSGVYLIHLVAGDTRLTRKMTLLK
ncbi:MXAN_6640 family putative metalloprotease [Candidatus Omnitrophota bacterium]